MRHDIPRGGLDVIVGALISAVGRWKGPRVMPEPASSVLYCIAVIPSLHLNTATAVLMAPIAPGTAHQMQSAALSFAMTIASPASAAFAAWSSSPGQHLVLESD